MKQISFTLKTQTELLALLPVARTPFQILSLKYSKAINIIKKKMYFLYVITI